MMDDLALSMERNVSGSEQKKPFQIMQQDKPLVLHHSFQVLQSTLKLSIINRGVQYCTSVSFRIVQNYIFLRLHCEEQKVQCLYWSRGDMSTYLEPILADSGRGQGTPWTSRQLITGPSLMAEAAMQGANCTLRSGFWTSDLSRKLLNRFFLSDFQLYAIPPPSLRVQSQP